MKRYNKWTYALLPAILVMAVAGCSKFLDRKPLGVELKMILCRWSGRKGILTLWRSAKRWDERIPSISFKNIRSDDALKGSTTGDASYITPIFDNFQYDAAQGQVTIYWDDHYNFITLM